MGKSRKKASKRSSGGTPNLVQQPPSATSESPKTLPSQPKPCSLSPAKPPSATSESPEKPAIIELETIRLTPLAFAKLCFLRDLDDAEVGGFCWTPNEPDLIEDIILVKQEVSGASVDFDDNSISDMVVLMVERDIPTHQFMRIWVHTHPGNSARPSGTDYETFGDVFTGDATIMLILAKGGQFYAEAKFIVKAGKAKMSITRELEVEVDFSADFPASNTDQWREDYKRLVSRKQPSFSRFPSKATSDPSFWLYDAEQATTANSPTSEPVGKLFAQGLSDEQLEQHLQIAEANDDEVSYRILEQELDQREKLEIIQDYFRHDS